MQKIEYRVIRTARDGVDELDEQRRQQNLSQMSISEIAEMPDTGQQYFRMYKSGDVKLSKFLRYLRAVGMTLVMMRKE